MRQAYNNYYYYNYTTVVRISNFGGKLNVDVYYNFLNFQIITENKT